VIASGKPFRPSTTAISTSSTPPGGRRARHRPPCCGRFPHRVVGLRLSRRLSRLRYTSQRSSRPLPRSHPAPARPIGNIYCGTCSWADRTLIESGGFYAADIRSPAARLRYYAQVFPIVEVDAT
jgi:hypothetical protein